MSTTYTPNFHLGKQEDTSDTFAMSVITDNADIIDTQMKANSDDTLANRNGIIPSIFFGKENIMPLSWSVGGIDSSGADTSNSDYRRSSYFKGQDCYVAVEAEGYTIIRYMYELDGTFVSVSSSGVQGTTFYIRSDRLYRFQAYKSNKNYDTIITDVTVGVRNYNNSLVKNIEISLWEKGAFASATGLPSVSSTRIRTTIDISSFAEDISVDEGYSYIVFIHNKTNGAYIGVYGSDGVSTTVSWISTRSNIGSYLRKNPTYSAYVVLRKNDNTNVSTDIYSHIHFYSDIIKHNEVVNNIYRNTYPFYEGLLSTETIANTTITDLSDLTNKTCYLVGDSMVAAGTLDTYLNARLGLVCSNYGYGGSTIAINNETLNGKSVVERVLGTATSDNISGSGDIWVVWGGYNDASYRNTPLGTIDSTDNSTIYGALKTICKTIQEKTNNPRVLLVTMHQATGRLMASSADDGKGCFVQRMREAFYEVGEMFGIPVLDLYKNGGISRVNDKQLTSDGVHLNDKGKQFIYPKIANAIKDMV